MKMNDCADVALKNLNIIDMYLLDPIIDKPNIDFLELETDVMIFANTTENILEENVNTIEVVGKNISFAQPEEYVSTIETIENISFLQPGRQVNIIETVENNISFAQPQELVTITNSVTDERRSERNEVVVTYTEEVYTSSSVERPVKTTKTIHNTREYNGNIVDEDVKDFSFQSES